MDSENSSTWGGQLSHDSFGTPSGSSPCTSFANTTPEAAAITDFIVIPNSPEPSSILADSTITSHHVPIDDDEELEQKPCNGSLSNAQIHPAKQHRSQLLQRFYDLHIGTSSAARQIFVYNSLELGRPDKLATTAAVDALCITQLGTTYKNARLQETGRILYGKAISLLSARIRSIHIDSPISQRTRRQLDDILGAVHALTSCSWFNCIGAGRLEWMDHAHASQKIIDSYGWNILSPTTVFALCYNLRYRAFFDSMTKRLKLSFQEPPADSRGKDPSGEFLVDYAWEVPSLLWRADKLLAARKSKSIKQLTVLRLLCEIGRCIARLKQWHTKTMKDFNCFSPQPHCRTVCTRTFKSFRALSGEYLDVFPLAYSFQNIHFERDFRILSMCLLNLDQAIMDIHQSFPEHCEGPQLEIQRREARRDAATAATDICMLIPWNTQEQYMTFAGIHSFQPLHYAACYYERQGELLHLAWCNQVTKALSEKYGITIRYTE